MDRFGFLHKSLRQKYTMLPAFDVNKLVMHQSYILLARRETNRGITDQLTSRDKKTSMILTMTGAL